MATATISPATSLTNLERADLDQLEARISDGISTWRAVAKAHETIKCGKPTFEAIGRDLLEIDRRQLFRPTYATFIEYLRRRWKICRSRAYQLRAAAKVVEKCQAEGVPPPRSEWHARLMRRGASMPITAAPTPADEFEEEDDEIEDDVADRAYRQRPGLAMTARVEKLLAELRKIHAKHPWRTRADELLDLYRDTVLPWPAK
ncbi:MAG TPA: hypothetical protein VNX28_14775 [Gemmataceae bacterium]|jgi:hypothetical protein|nr:hypothetical protein [Gemmataceae bacterium]